MAAESEDYIDIVVDYIRLHKIHILKKIMFKSEVIIDRKENAPLKRAITLHRNKLNKYKWSLIYEFQTDNTHNLIFVNKNDTAKQSQKATNKNLRINQSEMNQKLSLFMQITAVNDVDFIVEVILDEPQNKPKILFIKEIDHENNEFTFLKIEKGHNSGKVGIYIDEQHDENYHLALYDDKQSESPTPNSNQIHFIILKDKQQFPPANENYKPQCIDLSSVLNVKDDEHNKLNIYWTIPTRSFGNISYKIMMDDSKEEQIVDLLPLSIASNSIPMSFRVITITKVGDIIYESNPSQVIVVENMEIEM
eukprot:11112_1